jgi:hypothetical protein
MKRSSNMVMKKKRHQVKFIQQTENICHYCDEYRPELCVHKRGKRTMNETYMINNTYVVNNAVYNFQ